MSRTNKKCPICNKRLVRHEGETYSCPEIILLSEKELKSSIYASHYGKDYYCEVYRFINLIVSVHDRYTIIQLFTDNTAINVPRKIPFITEKQFLDKIKLCILFS